MCGASKIFSRQPLCHIEIGEDGISLRSSYEYLGVTLEHHLVSQQQTHKSSRKPLIA